MLSRKERCKSGKRLETSKLFECLIENSNKKKKFFSSSTFSQLDAVCSAGTSSSSSKHMLALAEFFHLFPPLLFSILSSLTSFCWNLVEYLHFDKSFKSFWDFSIQSSSSFLSFQVFQEEFLWKSLSSSSPPLLTADTILVEQQCGLMSNASGTNCFRPQCSVIFQFWLAEKLKIFAESELHSFS